MIVINESGLYALILSSKLPSAKRFKRWTMSELLPYLRRDKTASDPDLRQNVQETEEKERTERFSLKENAGRSELQIFSNPKFGSVRTITEGGKTLFCGSDVAGALGYKRPNDAISAHCRGTVKRRITDSIGRDQETNFISEGDIYRLAAKSELPGAEQFESWIFDEVLPSIRKHGAYMTPETLEAAILNPDTLIKVCMALKSEQEQRRALEIKVEADRPKVEFADAVYESTGTITVEKFAKLLHDREHLQIGRNRLYALLRSLGYLKSNNMPYQNYLDAGWFETCEVMRYGNPYVMTLITGKGQRRLFDEIMRHYSTAWV